VGLEEAPKHEILAHRDGDAVRRRVNMILIDRATGVATVAVADVTSGEAGEINAASPGASGTAPLPRGRRAVADGGTETAKF
ncbi:hypothetical protein ACFWWC_40775, partial [Streptomyces sp. NPDC058642]